MKQEMHCRQWKIEQVYSRDMEQEFYFTEEKFD